MVSLKKKSIKKTAKRQNHQQLGRRNASKKTPEISVGSKPSSILKKNKASREFTVKYDLSKLIFNDKDVIGEGTYSKVYKFRFDKHKIDKKYVVKYIKVQELRKYYGKDSDSKLYKMFSEEVNALVLLSKHDVTPKIYGIYIDLENNKMYYVLEKLDYTLGDMFRNNTFNSSHIKLFINSLKKLAKTRYRHSDLHIDNVMFNEKKNKFYLIDFGRLQVLNKKTDSGYYFTAKSDSDNIALIDGKKDLERGVLGSSGYSAISMVYQYLLKNSNEAGTKKAILSLRQFIKHTVPKHRFNDVIFMLEHNSKI